MGADEKLVPISAFDEFARAAFPNYKSLNRLQSKLFEAAYHSNENLLVCAPTGNVHYIMSVTTKVLVRRMLQS